MHRISLLLSITFSLLLSQPNAFAAGKITLKGKVKNAVGYQVMLIDGAGKVSRAKLASSGAFSFKSSKLKGATLILVDADGRAVGPIVLSVKKQARKAYLGLSGKTADKSTTLNLGAINLKTGYGVLAKGLASSLVIGKGKLVANTDTTGNPAGAASGGLITVENSQRRQAALAATSSDQLSSPGSDTDADGIIDALDPDLDGDGLVNIADPDFAGNDNATYSSLFQDLASTLNANIGSVTQDDIDQAIGGENMFNISFWFSLPPESTITGGHVICADGNEYCNRTDGSAIYGGLTESDAALRGQPWKDMNMDGSGYPNLEPLDVRGFKAVAASIQPRKGTEAVRPGDTFLIEFTNSTGAVLESKLLTLSPFLVTVPALKSYVVNSVESSINYADANNTVGSIGNPIVTDGSGLVTFKFWRPQRLLYRSEVAASESDRYRDIGHLKYGVLVDSGNVQFTCAGLYSNLSSDLTEVSNGLGTDNSPFPDQGAELFPLRDGSDDTTPDPARFLTLTVDLRQCLTRASQSTGTKRVSIIARGEDLSGGANSSAQIFWATVQ